MTKTGKIALGAATIWPVAYMIILLVVVFGLAFAFAGREMPAPERPPVWLLALFALHALTILSVLGLMIFYMIDAFRNERVAQDKKVLWAVMLFFGNLIAMPVYWYLYIWREPDALPPAADTSFGR
ncbi:MAG TPA: hypothetical protein VIP46_08665 [Pyrinomonadaceae bacterium]